MNVGLRISSASSFFSALLLSLASAHAGDILDSAEKLFFRPGDATRVGIEVEMGGLTARMAAEIVAKKLGGTIQAHRETITTDIREYDVTGKPIYNERVLEAFSVKNTTIGRILLKPENNQIDDIAEGRLSQQIVELVTEPIRFPDVARLNEVLGSLKAAGGSGTSAKRAVSTQVNVEMFSGNREQVRIGELIDLMRVYLRPESRAQIESRLRIPEIRKPYVAQHSSGFMRRLLDPSYNPSEREFFDDFLYRQSLELLGDSQAWNDPIDAVRKRLLTLPNPIVPSVVKQNSLRVSSLLMWMYPEDPFSTLIQQTGWAKPAPIVEFREWNTNFDAERPAKQALGLKSAAAEYGYFEYDRLLEALTGTHGFTKGCLGQQLLAK